MTTSDRVHIINTEFILPLFIENGVEDTPENRLAALQGLQQAWNEDDEKSIEKSMFQFALTLEIINIQTKVRINQYRGALT